MTEAEEIEDKIKHPDKWFEWYAREPVSEEVLRELLCKKAKTEEDD